MRIALISDKIYPCNSGGVEIFNYYFIQELATQGHTIWVFTLCDYDWNNNNIHCVKLWKTAPGLVRLSIYFSIILNLIKLKNKIDLIHIPYTSNEPLAFPILFIKKLIDLPYVMVIHGGGMFEWKIKILHKLFFENADGIIAVSETIKREYEKRSARKIKVVPPLVPFHEARISKDKLRDKYGISNKEIVILSLGSINTIKGSDILFNAFLSLSKEYIELKNLKLIYVGDGDKRAELEKITIDKNFNQYIKFYGRIPNEKVSEFYKMADIYIIPSLFEGKPISLLEAMFNGLPIIGSNISGINNHIIHEKNGILFKKGNSNDLRNKLMQLVEDHDLAQRLGVEAKNDYSKQYVFQNMISDHLKIYSEVINLEHNSILVKP